MDFARVLFFAVVDSLLECRLFRFLLWLAAPPLLFCLRVLNWFARALPLGWQSLLIRSEQPFLRLYLLHRLSVLPDPGLFEAPPYSADTLQRFSQFCEHVAAVHAKGPRNLLLKKLSAETEQLARQHPEVAWLLATLKATECNEPAFKSYLAAGCSQPPSDSGSGDIFPVSFHDVRNQFRDFPAGANYLRWEKLCKAAEKTIAPETIELMREGMRQGSGRSTKRPATSSSSSRPARSGMPEDLVEERIQQVMAAHRQKQEQRRAEAEAFWQQSVLTCPQYQLYRRVHDIWERYGLAHFEEEHGAQDQSVGNERLSRGASFEERNEELVFRMLCDSIGARAGGLHKLRSLFWDNTDPTQPKLFGEVDLTVYDQRNRAVVLCEFKTSFYELAAARRQCRPKLDRHIRLRHARAPVGQGSISTHGGVPIFMVTTIPSHNFLQGAEPKIIAELTQWIYHTKLDMNDPENARRAIDGIRTTLEIDESPQTTLRRNWDRVFIII